MHVVEIERMKIIEEREFYAKSMKTFISLLVENKSKRNRIPEEIKKTDYYWA
jgi:hypothetical protein